TLVFVRHLHVEEPRLERLDPAAIATPRVALEAYSHVDAADRQAARERVVLTGQRIIDPVVRLSQGDGRDQIHAPAGEAQAELLRRIEAPPRDADVAIEVDELGARVEGEQPAKPTSAEDDLRYPLVGALEIGQ